MRRPIGTPVYFIKGFKDNSRPGVIIRNEGTIYLNKDYPVEKQAEVIVGQITLRRGEISLPYYDNFFTFSKRDVWGSDKAPNSTKTNRLSSLEIKAQSEFRNKMHFKTNGEASKFYQILKHKRIDCKLSGNFITDISRMATAERLLKEHNESLNPTGKDVFDFKLDISSDKDEDKFII